MWIEWEHNRQGLQPNKREDSAAEFARPERARHVAEKAEDIRFAAEPSTSAALVRLLRLE